MKARYDEEDDLVTTITVAVDGTIVLTVVGEVDLSSVVIFREAIKLATEDGNSALVLELSRVDFMDSTGLLALLESRSHCSQLVLRNPSEAIRRLVQTAGLSDSLSIEP